MLFIERWSFWIWRSKTQKIRAPWKKSFVWEKPWLTISKDPIYISPLTKPGKNTFIRLRSPRGAIRNIRGYESWYTGLMDLLSTRQATFVKQNISGLRYSAQKVSAKEFENCTFKKCIFIECVFDSCQFTDCTFSDCSISAVKPYNSRFNAVRFTDSKVMGFDWTKAKSIRSLAFERCDISYSNFSFLKIPRMKFIECVAHEVSFSDGDFSEGEFTGTDFAKSIFSNTNLTRANFRKAQRYGIDIKFNTIKGAKFSLPEAASLLKSFDILLEDWFPTPEEVTN